MKINLFKNTTTFNFQSGYIALASMLVIMVVVLVIGTSVSLLAISNAQLSLAENKESASLDIAESCVEETLLRLNETGSLPSSITLPGGSCSVTMDSQSGYLWTFTVSNTYQTYYKAIQVTVDRSTDISISSWKEL